MSVEQLIVSNNNVYILKNRCPKYDNIPSSCIMVADPNDPNCCQAPQCNNVTAGVQGSITGSGHPPTVNSKYYIGCHILYVHHIVKCAEKICSIL